MTKTDYKPIDCDFYDHFEIHAMRGTWVEIEYEEGRNIQSLIGKIKTLETKKKEEYVITDSGLRIRLDRVTKLIPLNPGENVRAQLLDKMDYNYWANDKIIRHLDDADQLPANVKRWMSHILNTHDIWNKRVLGLSTTRRIWDEYPSSEWVEINEEIHEESFSILRNDDPSRMLSFKDSSDNEYDGTVSEIMYHIINHGTYHGGQIAYELRNEGISALPTDYIIWKRGQKKHAHP